MNVQNCKYIQINAMKIVENMDFWTQHSTLATKISLEYVCTFQKFYAALWDS